MTGPLPQYSGWAGRFLEQHLGRTGAREAALDDPYAHVQVRMLRALLGLVEAACEDEHLDPAVAHRIVERVVYGAVPSPADVEYRRLLVERPAPLRGGYWPLGRG